MKRSKWMGIAVAVAMLASSMSALSVSAADEVLMGDIDNDSYLTGHDTAMLSRYLLDDTYTLTEDQLSRADITGDGLIDEADVTWIQVNEEYILGDYDLNGYISADDAYEAMVHVYEGTVDEMTPLQFNLLDVDANGYISYMDAQGIMMFYANRTVGFDSFCGEPFCYYYHYEEGSFGSIFNLGDVDNDGVLTDHDALLAAKGGIQRDDPTGWYTLQSDVNFDGKIDQADADWIHEHAEYGIGELRKDGTLGDSDAAYMALQIYATESVGRELEIVPGETYDSVLVEGQTTCKIGELDYNLLDANADGKVDTIDAQLLLTSTVYISVGRSYESVYQDVMLSR